MEQQQQQHQMKGMYNQMLDDSVAEEEQLQSTLNSLWDEKADMLKTISELKNEVHDVKGTVRDLKDEVCDLKDKLDATKQKLKVECEVSERRFKQASATERRAYNKIQDLSNAHRLGSDPYTPSSFFLKILSTKGFSNEEISEDVLKSLFDRKIFRPHMKNAIMESLKGENITEDAEISMYKNIWEKFPP
jgi:hypothetical protein